MNSINNSEKNYNVVKAKGRYNEENNFDNNSINNNDEIEEKFKFEKQSLQTETKSKLSKTHETIPRLSRKILTTKTPMIKKYWEKNIEKENQEKLKQFENMKEKKKSYEFPRWRSIDAMSASLVASSNQTALIPNDSIIPEFRKQLIDNSEKNAEIERNKIKMINEQKKIIKKGKSMETLTVPSLSTPWYDREQIKESVSKESISDVSGTREKWKSGAVYNKKSNIRSNYNLPSNYAFSDKSQNISNLDTKKISSDKISPIEIFEQETKVLSPQSMSMHDNIEHISSTLVNSTQENVKNNTDINRNDLFKQENKSSTKLSISNITLEHYYFLKFLHEKKNLCDEFNIVIPNNVIFMMNEIVNCDKYCLVVKSDTKPKNNFKEYLTPTLSEASSFVDSLPKQGRFVKNQHSQNGSNNTLRYRKNSDNSQFQNIHESELIIESLQPSIPNGQNYMVSNVNQDKQYIHKNNFYGNNYYNM
uniref:HTH La-type RNA-binding domain-containing protein n=1 Tax=Strongyloides stercoralis TaxID=6248 RepID=A0A0K0EH44_STRER